MPRVVKKVCDSLVLFIRKCHKLCLADHSFHKNPYFSCDDGFAWKEIGGLWADSDNFICPNSYIFIRKGKGQEERRQKESTQI